MTHWTSESRNKGRGGLFETDLRRDDSGPSSGPTGPEHRVDAPEPSTGVKNLGGKKVDVLPWSLLDEDSRQHDRITLVRGRHTRIRGRVVCRATTLAVPSTVVVDTDTRTPPETKTVCPTYRLEGPSPRDDRGVPVHFRTLRCFRGATVNL